MYTHQLRPGRVRIFAVVVAAAVLGACTSGGSSDTTTTGRESSAAAGSETTLGSTAATSAFKTFVGRSSDDPDTYVAVATDGIDALAYVCDGKAVAQWFRGSVAGGQLDLVNPSGAHLTVALDSSSGAAGGSVTIGERRLAFSLDATDGTGSERVGLFRRDVTDALGERRLTGWIALPDGTERGLGVRSAVVGGGVTGGGLVTIPSPNPLNSSTTTSSTTSSSTTSSSTTSSSTTSSSTTRPPSGGPGGVIPAELLEILLPDLPDLRVDLSRLPAPPVAKRGGGEEFVIVGMGDSFSSGEGAPEIPANFSKPDYLQCTTWANTGAGLAVTSVPVLIGGQSVTFNPDRAPFATLVGPPNLGADLTRLADTPERIGAFLGTVPGAVAALANAASTAAAAARANAQALAAPTNAAAATAAAAANAAAGNAALAATGALASMAAAAVTANAGFADPLGVAKFLIRYMICAQIKPAAGTPAEATWGAAQTQSRPAVAANARINDPVSEATPCHRSFISGPALAARQLGTSYPDPNVVFKSFACSGARTEHIFKTPYLGTEFAPTATAFPPQVQQLGTWAATANGRKDIDALYMGIGGNDTGFGLVILACVLPLFGADSVGLSCNSALRGVADDAIATGTASVTANYPAIDDRLDALARDGVAVRAVYVPDVPDVVHDQNGNLCEARKAFADQRDLTENMTSSEAKFAAETIIPTLGALFRKNVESVDAGNDRTTGRRWKFVTGMRDAFRLHGVCSSDPWVNSNNGATKTQGAFIGVREFTQFQALQTNPFDPTIGSFVRDFASVRAGLDANKVAFLTGVVLPFFGTQLSHGIVHPNVNGYRLGYTPFQLEQFHQQAKVKFTPAAPNDVRQGVTTATSMEVRWHDNADNEVFQRVIVRAVAGSCAGRTPGQAAASITVAPGSTPSTVLPGVDGFAPDAQRATFVVTASSACEVSVQSCGVRGPQTTANSAVAPLCSAPTAALVFRNFAPAAPSNLTATIEGAGVRVRWDPVPDVDRYGVTMRQGTRTLATAAVSATTALLGVLPQGEATISVVACFGTFCSASSVTIGSAVSTTSSSSSSTPTTSITSSTSTPTTTTAATLTSSVPSTSAASASSSAPASTVPAPTTAVAGSGTTVAPSAPTVPPTSGPAAPTTVPPTTAGPTTNAP